MVSWNCWMRLALAGLIGLAGCGGGGSSNNPQIRLLNASTGYASLDFLVNDGKTGSAIAYGSASGYADVKSGDASTQITRAGSSTALQSSTRSLAKKTDYTVIAYGSEGSLKTLEWTENEDDPASGKARVQVVHAAPDAGSVDVYLTGSDEALADATPLSAAVAPATLGGYSTLSAGTWRVRVTGANDKTDLRLDVRGIVLASQQVAALILTSGSGGTLVNAVLATQRGAVASHSNTQARVRLVAGVGDNARVSASLNSVALMSAAQAPRVGNYVLVDAGSPALTLSVNGSSVTLSSPTLLPGGDHSLLLWGSASAPKLNNIVDDNRLPAVATNAKMRLVHALADFSGALTLTADFSPVADDLAQGGASSFSAVANGTAVQLEVSSAALAAPLYTGKDVNIAAKAVYTLFMFGTQASPSGVLRRDR